MPAAADSPYSEDWVRLAAEDFRRVARRLAEEDTEDAAFHLQEAIEKYLKGYLLSRGWGLKRTHNLEVLLDDAVRYDAALEGYRELVPEEGPNTAEFQVDGDVLFIREEGHEYRCRRAR